MDVWMGEQIGEWMGVVDRGMGNRWVIGAWVDCRKSKTFVSDRSGFKI